MPVELLKDVFYIPRGDYADPNLPRGGYTIGRGENAGVDLYLLKTDAAIHHAVSTDRDRTPDIWETFDKIIAKSKAMQVVRPDLGNDNPYGHMLYLMPRGVICIVEGRGYNRTMAATRGHNTKSWALVFMGNFHDRVHRVDLAPWLPGINRYLPYVKQHELPNLVMIKPHRQYSLDDGRGYNACPGDDVIAVIDQFSLEDDMASEDLQKKINEAAIVGIVAEKIRANVALTPRDKSWSIAVIKAQDDAPANPPT